MYFVMHSTVTKFINYRLSNINQLKKQKMRTLNTNQLTDTLRNTKSHNWNNKRRYR